MRIAVDAMGGDRAPGAIVDGAVRAARRSGVAIALVGLPGAIEEELRLHDVSGLEIEIVEASEAIAMDEKAPSEAVRARKDNSLSVAAQWVRKDAAHAMVTAGHTGAAMTAAAFGLGRVRGVPRPALVVPFPAIPGPVALLDVGANASARPAHMVQFAVMGDAYARAILGYREPRVGLLSIGEERGKGNDLVQRTAPLLEATDLKFVGNVEGIDVPLGTVEVVVTDGFTGNVLLKFAEGIAELVRTTLNEEARRDPLSSVGAVMMKPALGRVRLRWDYRRMGGAMLLGVRGAVVIGHGRSDAEAVVWMIDAARRSVETGLVDAIADGVARAAKALPTDGANTEELG
jgi:phosphate acyltransferase